MKEPAAAAASDSILPSIAATSTKRHTSPAAGRYKLWALVAILLLALWSMLTGTVTLKRSSRRPSDDDLGGPDPDDIDVLVRPRPLCLIIPRPPFSIKPIHR